MERYFLGLFLMAIKTIWWLFMVANNTGPWIMDKVFEFIVHPIVGSERLLRMTRLSMIPISSMVLGALWGGLWLLFWGALGVPEFGWWGVAFGVIAGWKAGTVMAHIMEQVRFELELEKSDQPTSSNVADRQMDSQAGEIDYDDPEPLV